MNVNLSNKAYNFLKWVALVLLPAAGTLYVALAALWDWGNVQAVAGTILAVDTFLGGLLHLSTATYKSSGAAYDGTFNVEQQGDKQLVTLALNKEAEEIVNKDSLTFKVAQVDPSVVVDPNVDPAPGPNGF